MQANLLPTSYCSPTYYLLLTAVQPTTYSLLQSNLLPTLYCTPTHYLLLTAPQLTTYLLLQAHSLPTCYCRASNTRAGACCSAVARAGDSHFMVGPGIARQLPPRRFHGVRRLRCSPRPPALWAWGWGGSRPELGGWGGGPPVLCKLTRLDQGVHVVYM